MQLSVSVNDRLACVAGIPTHRGFVSVHVIAYPGGEVAPIVKAAAHYDPNSHETIHLEWTGPTLALGDTIKVQCADSLPVTPPTHQLSTRDDERICVRDPQVARSLNTAIVGFEAELSTLVGQVAASGSPSDLKLFKRAVGHVLASLGDHLLVPLWNSHPALRPRHPEEA